ncbi:maltokinase N-terminal cap-like domain-containing protein [Agrococcus sp. KRD186]|uniref:maltokinase N-terminal cap-like domain-containing protein n=1 Tax=Agrococcus sp. KRD186 TaxID=2729730 RepID=UPI0019CF6EBD|nr:hypothetical protein [Agrococcus sp. KRD186]
MSATTPTDAPDFGDPQVIDAIAAWMPTTRWYPLKGLVVDVTLERSYDLGDAAILLLRAGDTLLQVPVAWRDEPGAAGIAQLDLRWLIDACHDADAVQALIDVASGNRAVEGLSGEATSTPELAGDIRVVSGGIEHVDHRRWRAPVDREGLSRRLPRRRPRCRRHRLLRRLGGSGRQQADHRGRDCCRRRLRVALAAHRQLLDPGPHRAHLSAGVQGARHAAAHRESPVRRAHALAHHCVLIVTTEHGGLLQHLPCIKPTRLEAKPRVASSAGHSPLACRCDCQRGSNLHSRN